MTRHRTTILSTALATVLVAGLDSRPAHADPGEPTAVETRSYNHAPVTRVGDGEGFGLIRGTRLTSEGNDTTVRAWPGFVAGFQI